MDSPLEHAWHLMAKLEKLLPDLKTANGSEIVRMFAHETEQRDAQHKKKQNGTTRKV